MGALALWILCCGVSLPMIMLGIECLAGSFARDGEREETAAPAFTVVMPAHNEASGIETSVDAVIAQLREGDQLIVVADNCTDDTAAIAARTGATVISRTDPANRGKGHALEFGRLFVTADPREIVIVVDADCRPAPGALRQLAATAWRCDAVVQGAYLLEPPPQARAIVRISCFAFLVKNLVRQVALQRMAGAVLLQGSGMAFPFRIFHRVQWSSNSLVEDLELGIRLLANGERVVFERRARFHSLASSELGTATQRRRWEHGMLQSMFDLAPRLTLAARKGRPGLLLVALDLLVPPTVLLLGTATAIGALTVGLVGLQLPAVVLLSSYLLLALGLAGAWYAHGRGLLPARSLAQMFRYAIWKLPIIVQFVTRRERHWIRTERES